MTTENLDKWCQAQDAKHENVLTVEDKLRVFCELLTAQQKAEHERKYTHPFRDFGTVHLGKKYAKVDLGGSGRYMVEMDTETIYGIKAYGVIHRGHQYGTLDTIQDWDWSGYTAQPKNTAAIQKATT